MFRLQDDDPFLTETFYRPASGPGGQHLNKTSSGVRLQYDYTVSPLLPDDVKQRLSDRLSGELLLVKEKGSRSLQKNRETARVRLTALILSAFTTPKKRRKTKATRASCEKRLAVKARRSAIKANRKPPVSGD